MRRRRLAGLLVAMVALIVYFPVLSNGFVNADDERGLFGDPAFRSGTLSGMLAIQPGRAGYMPLGRLFNVGIYRATGGRLVPFHVASLLLHAANAALLFFLILRVLELGAGASDDLEGGRIAAAAAASIFFAAHPLHAEIVCVASSAPDLAAALFLLFTLVSYLEARKNKATNHRGSWAAASLVSFALCGLTRWTAASLPFILLILDAYPLRRLDGKALIEKVPYFLIAALVVCANAYAKMTAVGFDGVYAIAMRPGAAVAGAVFYAWKYLVPGELEFFYIFDRPERLMGLSPAAGVLVVLAAAAALARGRRRILTALAAGGVYLVMLAPTLITTTNGWIVGHNRYAYLPGMALCAALAGALLATWKMRARHGPLPALSSFAIVASMAVGFGVLAHELASDWHDKSRLWSVTAAKAPDSFFAHNVLGEATLRRKYYVEAVREFQAQLVAHPNDALARRRLEELAALLERRERAVNARAAR